MGRRCALLSLTVLCSSLLPTFVEAQTRYHVDGGDPSASDSNAGSMASPWRTLSKCASTLSAGDSCVVASGEYAGFRETTSGTRDGRIVYQAQPGDDRPSITSGIDLSGTRYVTIDGFHLDGAEVDCSFSDRCSFIAVVNNVIEEDGSAGQTGIANLDGDDILISGNVFEGVTDDPVRPWGLRWVIRNNIVLDEVDVGDDHMDMSQTWCGPTHVLQSYTLVENNLYADVSGGNVHFFLIHETMSCGSTRATNLIIRHNQVRNIGSGFVGLDNDSGAPGFRGVAVYNNTVVASHGGSHASWQDYDITIDDVAGTAYAMNNILFDAVDPAGAEVAYPPSIPVDCSLVYDPDAAISADGALRASSGSIVDMDPLFTDPAHNDFRLRSDSPAIDHGCPLTTVATSDGGSGTTFVVVDPWLFQPGWAGASGDCIAVGTVSNTACVTAIDYATGVLRLDASIARADGDPVWLYSDSDGTVVLRGSGPDIGAVESGEPDEPGCVVGACDGGTPASDAGVASDDDAGASGSDAGAPSSDASSMAALDGGSTSDAGLDETPPMAGNCACSTAAKPSAPPFAVGIVVFVIAFVLRRRRGT